MARLLVCQDCGVMYKLRDYDGPAEYDMELAEIVERHLGKASDPRPESHRSLIFRADDATAEKLDMETEVKKELMKNHIWVKDFRDELKVDALKCFNAHGRPKADCQDYCSDAKTIGRKVGIPKEKRQYLCMYCFSGDTTVPTAQGTMRLDELAAQGGGDLLVGPSHGQYGSWRWTEVRSFGEQALWEITLKRGTTTKVVHATGDHRWLTSDYEQVLTVDLEGKALAGLTATSLLLTGESPSSVGVMHGFTFGDGTQGPGNRPAYVTMYDSAEKDKALHEFFSSCRTVAYQSEAQTGITYVDLPRSWKSGPDFAESRSYLLGFAAGYFAADGTVDKNGQPTMYSARRENVQMFKDILTLLGVRTNPIRSKVRVGFGNESELFMVSFRTADLPDSFWIIEEHAQRVSMKNMDVARNHIWRVESVRLTDRVEEVYCAVVPDTERFALSDDLLTMNCPVHEYYQHRIRKAKGLYDKA